MARPLIIAAVLLAVLPLAAGMVAAPAASTDAACSAAARDADHAPPTARTAAGDTVSFPRLIETLATRRVIYVGEQHDRYDHHLNQLEIVCGLHGKGPLAIGLEFFQTPFQGALDAYVFQHGDLQRLLREGEWFTRWRYDPRLYAPVFEYARANRIPLVALNVPGELVSQVGTEGMESLDAAARSRLPGSIDEGPARYRARLEQVFAGHPKHDGRTLERFIQAQLLWDEGMAQNAADYLLEHPQRRLVVLAGEGHVAWGDGIPDRLSRRLDVPRAVVLQAHAGSPGVAAADFVIDTSERALPAPGRLGVTVGDEDGAVRITGFSDPSAARDAGLETGDRLLAVDERAVSGYADVRLALWHKAPGDPVTVAVRRGGTVHRLAFEVR